ncbi:hypothetical protein ABFS82_08G159900 [Erythranthe guttata]|uniref:anther-specific protein SF18-like n=1 Tax=Erythranthe guttata TaxID=4155 RepID=UPI00064D8982|nr:PREDICTED: anther-specific protein SF18-like [Erythranthe guttata]|eukprot:XP_012841610.1 PREDICTED: anther-specific protein SF18-like [Erythranthe guttata]
MAIKLLGVVLLVSLMVAEASVCETKSQIFKGACFRNDNCASICEKEGYLTGRCKGFFKCICAKDCGGPNNNGGVTGGGGNPPVDGGAGGGGGGGGGGQPDGGAPPADGSDAGAPPDGPSEDPILTSEFTDIEI